MTRWRLGLCTFAAVLMAASVVQAGASSSGDRAAPHVPADCLTFSGSAADCQPDTPILSEPDPFAPVTGTAGLRNPALNAYIPGAEDDPLAMFGGRPLERYIIPEGGRFMDPDYGEVHYGVDYTYPDDYLAGKTLWVHPIGPGYVTARSACLDCFLEGDAQGRTIYRRPHYNFGYGGFVLVETPLSRRTSVYILYAHLNRDFVGLGDYVSQEDVIGAAGATGYAEQIHVHMEIRYGPPNLFWNADFTQWATYDRWMATMFVNPTFLVYPENHTLCLGEMRFWLDEQPSSTDLP